MKSSAEFENKRKFCDIFSKLDPKNKMHVIAVVSRMKLENVSDYFLFGDTTRNYEKILHFYF